MQLQKYKKSFTFELQQHIKYQDDNGECETRTLVLYAPSNQLTALKAKLRQKILAAFFAMSKNSGQQATIENNDKKRREEPIKSEEILLAIAASEYIVEIKEVFKKLLKEGCLSLDGKLDKITDWHLEQIDDDEFEEMMGEYAVNFIIPSWMKRLFGK